MIINGDLPSGYVMTNSLLLYMVIYSGFTHWKHGDVP
jgi:hypothetical protein